VKSRLFGTLPYDDACDDDGYYNDDVNYFTGKTVVDARAVTDFPSFSSSSNYYSWEFKGYFKAPADGTYTFGTTSDDASHLWIGVTSVSGFTTGNALVKSVDDLEYAQEYKNTWNNTLKNGALIGAGVTTCRTNFKNLGKFITLNQAISGKALPEPGDIAVYGGYHVGLVVKPFITDGKLTGFSSIGGNTGSSNFKNGGETKYYAKDYEWKKVSGFCKAITPFNKDVNYAKKV
jgi:hypothetical protein